MNLIICVGVAGSGKTTFANDYDSEVAIISRDNTRLSLCGIDSKREYFDCYRTNELENVVFNVNKAMATQIVKAKYHDDIIICDTNINKKTFNYWVEFAKEHKLKLKVKLFEVKLSTLIERNKSRPSSDRLPKDVIESMYISMKDMTKFIKEKYSKNLI